MKNTTENRILFFLKKRLFLLVFGDDQLSKEYKEIFFLVNSTWLSMHISLG